MRDYDREPIVVYSPYSIEQTRRFQRVHYRKNRRCALCALIAAVLIGVVNHFILRSASFALLLACALIAIYEGYRFICFNGGLYTQKVYERYRNSYRGGALYRFMSDHYTASSEEGAYKLFKDSRYDDVIWILETRDSFYLYNTPNMAQIIGKEGLRDGDTAPEAFSAFLKEKFEDIKYDLLDF